MIREYIAVSMEEYKTIRAEIKQSNINQFQALSFGAAAVGILLSAGFYSWDKTALITIPIFSIFIPALCFLITYIWLGEFARMIRGGNFILSIERKIEAIVPVPEEINDIASELDSSLIVKKPLSWEHFLRKPMGPEIAESGHMPWIYNIRLWIFPLVAAGSLLVAVGYLFPQLIGNHMVLLCVIIITLSVVSWFCMIIVLGSAFKNIKKTAGRSNLPLDH